MAAGTRGPVPKRTDQRLGHSTPARPTTARAASKVTVPAADRAWHPIAKRWYAALRKSGQAVFYEPSDWATAYLVAESISRELNPQPMVVGRGDSAEIEMVSLPPKGTSLAGWLKAMAVLMVTEGDRRRLRLELERVGPNEEPEVNVVSELDEYRRRLQSQ